MLDQCGIVTGSAHEPGWACQGSRAWLRRAARGTAGGSSGMEAFYHSTETAGDTAGPVRFLFCSFGGRLGEDDDRSTGCCRKRAWLVISCRAERHPVDLRRDEPGQKSMNPLVWPWYFPLLCSCTPLTHLSPLLLPGGNNERIRRLARAAAPSY